jgi:hypothetical protein
MILEEIVKFVIEIQGTIDVLVDIEDDLQETTLQNINGNSHKTQSTPTSQTRPSLDDEI